MRLESLFTGSVVSAKPHQTLGTAADLMDEHGVGAVVIEEQQQPIGIVTDRDLALALGTQRATPATHLREIMASPVATIGRHETVIQATRYMRDNALRRLVIVDQAGRLVGMVSLDDLLLLLSRELANLAEGVRRELIMAPG